LPSSTINIVREAAPLDASVHSLAMSDDARMLCEAPAAAAAAAAGNLRLYSLLARPLAGRAHVWGSRLTLRPGTVCTNTPYFEAPGTWVSQPCVITR
jgi:hypothetical protein